MTGFTVYKGLLQTKFRERSGSVVECLTRDRRHCVVVLEQDTFIQA